MNTFEQIATEVDAEVRKIGNLPHAGVVACHKVRKKYTEELAKLRNRNIIVYYSGWLQGAGTNPRSVISDRDFSMISSVVEQLDTDVGLDLILHLPGGDVEATRKIANFLKKKFSSGIDAFVPQIVMSAGTVIACAADCIHMGEESSLGIIEPFVNGFSAYSVVNDFQNAKQEMAKDDTSRLFWESIMGKYPPTLFGECRNAIKLSNRVVEELLAKGALANKKNERVNVRRVVKSLVDRGKPDKRLNIDEAREIGLNISSLKDDGEMNTLVKLVHRAYEHTMRITPFSKSIENHMGTGFTE